MSKSIWEILSPFAESDPPTEETKEETPNNPPAEEAPNETSDNAPTEETSNNTPAKESSSETPTENPEETPSETSEAVPLEPLLFRIIHKLMGCKIFVDLCKFIMMIFLGIILILTYGQIQKTEGCASFETIFAQFEANKLCNYFIDGDMDKLTAYIHIFTPTDGYQKDWENDLRNQVADSLTSIYQEKKLGKLAKKKNITCEYQKDKKTGRTHLVYTCHIEITSKEEMKLVFQKDGKKNFQISAYSEGKNADTLKKMTDYFAYLSNGYYRTSDYSISSLLCQKKGADYSVLSKYFHKNANRNSKKDTLGKDFVTKLTALLSNQIILTDAVFTPYEYNSKTKELSTCLMLRFENSRTNSSGILYQPFIVGLYGYAPTDMPKFYTEYMEETITSQIRNLFSISNP